MRRVVPLVLALALLAACAAGCGGDDEQGGPSTLPDNAAPADPVALTGRATVLALDPQTVGVLDDNNVAITPVAPARVTAAGVALPVTGGEIRPDTLAGRIEHDGGLAIRDGERRVVLRDFVIDTGSGQVTAETGAGRIPVLDLDLSLGKRRDTGRVIGLRGVPATLSAPAARALDDALALAVLAAGLPIARAALELTTGQ
jgi:predicted small lipoprotein YifL